MYKKVHKPGVCRAGSVGLEQSLFLKLESDELDKDVNSSSIKGSLVVEIDDAMGTIRSRL